MASNELLLKQVNQVITIIPGIGGTLGAVIISEIGGINRFDAPNKLAAVGAVSRKMCNIIFTVLRENRPYEPTPPKKTLEKG